MSDHGFQIISVERVTKCETPKDVFLRECEAAWDDLAMEGVMQLCLHRDESLRVTIEITPDGLRGLVL